MSIPQLPIKCLGHVQPIVQLAFSDVCQSGYYLASASLDGQTMLRHGDTGDWVGTFMGHSDCIRGVALNADATLLATASDDGTARLWNAVNGKDLEIFKHDINVGCVALDTQCKLLATGNLHSMVSTYSLEQSANREPVVYAGHTRSVRNVIFCRNDRCLLSSSYDRSVRLWDMNSGQETHCLILPHHAKSLELCADKETLTIAYGKNVLFMNLNNFNVLQQHKLSVKLMCASLHPQKETFVCASSSNYIYKHDYESGQLLHILKAHEVTIRSIKYSPDGEIFASAADDGSLRLWQQNVGKNYGLWRQGTANSDTNSSSDTNA